MLGKILTINKNSAIVEVNKENSAGIKDLINLHVIFEDSNKKILGEVDEILDKIHKYYAENNNKEPGETMTRICIKESSRMELIRICNKR